MLKLSVPLKHMSQLVRRVYVGCLSSGRSARAGLAGFLCVCCMQGGLHMHAVPVLLGILCRGRVELVHMFAPGLEYVMLTGTLINDG